MDADGLGERIPGAGMSPRARLTRSPRARLTGAVYLIYFLTAILAQILLSRKLVMAGNAANLIAYAFYIALTLLLYLLFRPVSRSISLVAAVFSLAGCAIGVLDVFHRAPAQVNALWFFGPYCLLLGYLIFRSTFLPRLIGVVMALAGLGWMGYLWPPVQQHLGVVIEGLGVVAEASLMLWLLVMGVDEERWVERKR
jgi:hypothetical protein